MKSLGGIAFILLLIGGINWGLMGLANFNLVTAVFGSMPGVEQIVYILVGLSAVYIGVTRKKELGL